MIGTLNSSTLAAAVLLLGVGIGYIACGDDDPPAVVDERYDLLCPLAGTPCANADGPLMVGVAKRDITPLVIETHFDCGLDQLCPGDAGYPGPDDGEGNGDLDGHPTVVSPPVGLGELIDDVNGNGFFDAVWIAGYGNARPALGVHDPIWARALVLRKGDTTMALVAVDLVGYPYDEVVRIRELLDPALGIDLVLVAATHTHEAPDSIGIWGFDEGTSGVDPAFMDTVRTSIVDSITEAAGGLKEARVYGAIGDSGVHPDATITQALGINNLIIDGRDPVIIDDDIRVLRFVDAADGTTIGTLINWQNHPEAMCSHNRFISSDFVHYLREAIENGIDRMGVVEPGLGGMAIFVNGAVGGMQSPGRVQIYDLDGSQIMETCETTNDVNDSFFDRARAFGDLAALDALRILRDSGEELTETDLSFATKTFRLPIENGGYHAMFLTGVFYGRNLFDFDRTKQITADNLPHLRTEVAVVNLGPVQAITIPGELLPEWFLGGYDGSATGPAQELIDSWFNKEPEFQILCSTADECTGQEIVTGHTCAQYRCRCEAGRCVDKNYNPPDIANAPSPPYLRDRMTRRLKFVFGLTPDELGYIIPLYNFKLDDRVPFIEDAPGDHYEETNSIGNTIGPQIEKYLSDLLAVVP